MHQLTRSGSLLLVLLIGLVGQAHSQGICQSGAGTLVHFDEGDDLADPAQNCFDLPKWCYEPIISGPSYELIPAGCDPTAGSCSVRATTPIEFPGNGSNPSPPLFSRGWVTLDWTDSSGGFAGACGTPGGRIVVDEGTAWIQIGGFSCAASPDSDTYTLVAEACGTVGACDQSVSIDIDLTLPSLQAEFCPAPPPTDECQECPTSPAGGANVGGGGQCVSPEQGSPTGNAELRYRAGGAGHPGFPGTSPASGDWTATLGLYWSHEAAQRIVMDPDESHVWLITEFGSFREFSDLVAGTYETNSPSDEKRTLKRTATGWELHDLDGTVDVFEEVAGSGFGRWESETNRNSVSKTAEYDLVTGQLTKVHFPDGRREDFIYYEAPDPAEGKLESITEVGVDGTTSRTWDYTWSGDELTRIDRPSRDGGTTPRSAIEFFYNDPDLLGYVTRQELVGTDGTRRVLGGWEFDDEGNVAKSWRGETTTDALGDHPGTNAVDLWVFAYDNPKLPTQTTVTDPRGDNTVFDVARDSASLKPMITKISGPCPICGLGPITDLEYTDPDNPLLPTATIDAKDSTRTEFEYNDDGLMTLRREAAGVSDLTRVTNWQYNGPFPAFVTHIDRPSTSGTGLREIDMVYDPSTGDLEERTINGTEGGVVFPGGGYKTEFPQYNPQGQAEIIDPPGFGTSDRTLFAYDAARGNLLPSSRTDPLLGVPTSFAYDPFNRRVAVTDPNGVTTETQYDDLDRVRKVIQRVGSLAGDDFDLGDDPVAGDLVTENIYNVFGDLFQTILPAGNVIEYRYDSAGRLTSIARLTTAGPVGECTSFELDGVGNREREELWEGDCTTGTSKSFTKFHYKNRVQLEKIEHADGKITEYAYDADGNLEKVWDANNPKGDPPATPTQTYVYDQLNRLIRVHQPWSDPTRPVCVPGDDSSEAITRYGYDVQDHLTSVTDAECNTTTYVYSDRDLLTLQTSPVSGITSFTYNEHGELKEETDARGVLTKRTPDELDRVKKVEYLENGTDLKTKLTIDYTYDDPTVAFSLGRLTEITRNGASLDYRYDRFGRVTQDGGLDYVYDDNSNREEITYPSGATATYTYDYADRQKTLTVGAQNVVTGATYLPSGPLATLTLGNAAVETRGFTTRYFPETIDLAGDRQRTWTYGTDDVGNVEEIAETSDCETTVTLEGVTLSGPVTEEACLTITATQTTIDSTGSVTFRAGESVELRDDFTIEIGATFVAEIESRIAPLTFTYDYLEPQYFLKCASGPWSPAGSTCQPAPSADALQWTYDRIGNRLSETRTFVATGPGPAGGAESSEATRILQTDTYNYEPNAVPMANTPILDDITLGGGGNRDYTYGSAGHLERVAAGANVIDFTSDAAGRLSGLSRLGEMAEFTYDGRSFLQQAKQPLGPSDQATTDPTYSSEGLLHCLTRQENAAATAETVDYFYFAGRPVAQRHTDGVADTWAFLTTDHLGTPVIATDLAGEEIWLGPFEPFGRDYLAGSGAGALDNGLYLRLPGQWEDGRWAGASIGADLYYNLQRWYEHRVGKYASADPLSNGLIINGVDIGALDLEPSAVILHQSLRGFYADNRDEYNYVRANPLYWTDVLGLDPCASVPQLPECRGAETGCCVLACIQEVRKMLCSWKRAKPWLATSAGILGGAAAGLPLIKTGLGALAAGAVGFGVGYTGGYLLFDTVVPFDMFRRHFKNCVNNSCGVVCRPDSPSFIDTQFATTRSEVFP